MTTEEKQADFKTLEMLALRLKEDSLSGMNLNAAAMRSIAGIIEAAIGAPLSWPSRKEGMKFADDYYSGSPSLRLAFNHGVKWTVEQYHDLNVENVEHRR